MKKAKIFNPKFIVLSLITFLFSFSFLNFLPQKANAASATFYLSPSSKTVSAGETLSASVMINSGGQAINSGEGSVTFSSDTLEYQSISTSGSIFTFWTSGPAGNNTSVSFGGGLANPGYNGSAGKVLTITWKVKGSGTATVTINGSKILANDGLGTNIYGGSSGGSFPISAPTVSRSTRVKSDSHPDQNSWYSNKNISLSWSARSASGYAYTLNQSAYTNPTGSVVSARSKTYENKDDGVWYFHVKAQLADGFGPVTHFKIQIDTVAPNEFDITLSQEGGSTDPTPKVEFEATDDLSGIDRYEGIVNNKDPSFGINSGEKLPKQHPGDHDLIIRAIDKAGNVRESSADYYIEGITPPTITTCPFCKYVGLLDPIEFEGASNSDDTILVLLNDEEIDRFKIKDNKIEASQNNNRVLARDSFDSMWKYTYDELLYPGTYSFSFIRTNGVEAESEPSSPCKVRVFASTIKIGKYSIPTIFILILLLLIIILLVLLVINLYKKLCSYASKKGLSLSATKKFIKRIFSRTEREIDKEIDETIPASGLSRGVVKEIKKDLKEKVHETLEDEEKNLERDDKNSLSSKEEKK